MAARLTGSKKFKALVADFVQTTAELGGTIAPEVVATELQQRIRAIATQIGVTETTALRSYFPDDWGRDMARAAYRQIQERDAHTDAAPEQQLPLRVVGRLVAALGQAMLFFTVNDGTDDPTCAFNPKEASEAITGLGMALVSPPINNDSAVTIAGNTLAWARDALIAFQDNLQHHRWSSCPCGEQHGQNHTDTAVLDAVRDDLLLIPTAH